MSLGSDRLIALILALCLTACEGAPQQAAPEPRLEQLNLPAGFAIAVFARVPGARSLRVADDGARIYVATRGSEVFAVLDPERDGIANGVLKVGGRAQRPERDRVAPDGTLFVAEQNRIIRLDGSGKVEVVVPPGVLPDFRHHGWRYAGFGPDGRLYVASARPATSARCAASKARSSACARMGRSLEVFARGVRNSVGFDWQPMTGELFFTDNGGDHLGDLVPPDELNHALEPGLHFGYPYVYGQGVPYPQFADRSPPQPTTPPALSSRRTSPRSASSSIEARCSPTRIGASLRRRARFLEPHRADRLSVMRVRFDSAASRAPRRSSSMAG